jgi:FKBP-type peptidyl-prolyl cis-trans isomerase FkpA
MKRVISALALLLAATSPSFAQDASSSAKASAASVATESAASDNITTLMIKDIKLGEGAEATSGHEVEVHYTGWLYDPKSPSGHGKKFDSSVGRGVFSFPLGAGRVIKGWDQGVTGMREGGKRTLIIPADMAYGSRNIANGLIPANSVLIFDVELKKVR